ncbi:MAG: demethoxyubiquinone hydroxylase family protein [Cyanobacteria bacterium SZAS-4]|nr:demethoxyubiquinone hydroxylase family protein [Cyanobacteria bacterium SZAS-4]
MIDDTIDDLNKLLEFEIGARDTYAQNLDTTGAVAFTKALEENRKSHSDRVASLQDAIKKLEGKIVGSAKIWGTFGKAMGGVTAPMGDKATIEILASGESSLLSEYKSMIEKRGHSAILNHLLEQQEESLRLIEQLKN